MAPAPWGNVGGPTPAPWGNVGGPTPAPWGNVGCIAPAPWGSVGCIAPVPGGGGAAVPTPWAAAIVGPNSMASTSPEPRRARFGRWDRDRDRETVS